MMKALIVSSFLHRHLFACCHLLGKGVLAVFTDIMDAGRPVTIEEKGKQFSNKVVVNPAFLHVFVTLGTRMKAFLLTAFAYFAP